MGRLINLQIPLDERPGKLFATVCASSGGSLGRCHNWAAAAIINNQVIKKRDVNHGRLGRFRICAKTVGSAATLTKLDNSRGVPRGGSTTWP
jgi:hypothetical protein